MAGLTTTMSNPRDCANWEAARSASVLARAYAVSGFAFQSASVSGRERGPAMPTAAMLEVKTSLLTPVEAAASTMAVAP